MAWSSCARSDRARTRACTSRATLGPAARVSIWWAVPTTHRSSRCTRPCAKRSGPTTGMWGLNHRLPDRLHTARTPATPLNRHHKDAMIMLKITISNTDGAVIAEGTCSDSGYFPVTLAGVYNAGLNREPARSIEQFGEAPGSADYPVGT